MMASPDPSTDDDLLHLRRALALAARSARSGGGPFGAVVVLAGAAVATGENGVVRRCDPTAHAEVQAIRATCAVLGRPSLEGATLYSSCEPCPMCLGAILWSRLDRVVFAADRAQAATAGFDDATFHRAVGGFPDTELVGVRHLPLPGAATPFRAWSRNSARIAY